ncbi:MAG: hypothetical protein MUF53_12270 [Gemmatimonadaceae bacterium]|jgi:hypothetical protein|nr:hypothetical protein [Gemmatimonadaceae bacterium]
MRRRVAVVLSVLALAACREADRAPSSPFGPTPPVIPTGQNGMAFGLWTPSRFDTCTREQHDRYSVIGPDGKRYPTWHPPIDEVSGCRFGHEHGRDPRQSDLYREIGDVPFGYANEVLMAWDPNGHRHEDHVGHKIEWENNVQLQRSLIPGGPSGVARIGVTCDFLTKLHQGTHSADAFANNMHELTYHVRCDDGTAISATVMTNFGIPGQFIRACDKTTVQTAGNPVPLNSPTGGGFRFIPDITCVREYLLVPPGQFSGFSGGLYEAWGSANYIRDDAGRQIAYFDPGFAVFSPSRFFDPSRPGNVGRSIDVCWMVEGDRRARGGECDATTANGTLGPLPHDDPRSAFNGLQREVYFNQTWLSNRGGPTVWYTDPFGGHARPTPFPGAIRQLIAAIDNNRGFALESQAFGAERNYGRWNGQPAGIHAPN